MLFRCIPRRIPARLAVEHYVQLCFAEGWRDLIFDDPDANAVADGSTGVFDHADAPDIQTDGTVEL